MSKKVKIWFSEEDAHDMTASFVKEVGQPIPLWNTWTYTDPKTGELTEIEMYLGNQDDYESESADGLDEASPKGAQ